MGGDGDGYCFHSVSRIFKALGVSSSGFDRRTSEAVTAKQYKMKNAKGNKELFDMSRSIKGIKRHPDLWFW